MPALSPTMETGSIAAWATKEGDAFKAGDALCQIETDKATLDFEAQDDGIIAKILCEGANARDIPVGVPVCVVVDDEKDVASFSDFVLPQKEGGSTLATAQSLSKLASPQPPAITVPKRDVAAEFALLPSARHLAESKGLDATGLEGTGKDGRVTKGDVLKALAAGVALSPLLRNHEAASSTSTSTSTPASSVASPLAAPAVTPSPTPTTHTKLVDVPVPIVVSSGTYTDVPNNNMRKVIARRLTESKRDVPHFYTSIDIELDAVLALRKELANKHDVKVSVNDFVLKACGMALRDVPEVNASYLVKMGEVHVNNTVDVSVAVATPTGLITPIVTHVDKIGLVDITEKVKDLAERARQGKLTPEEYQGGTFTVSNLGMFGIDEFTAVINPPQAAILAVGGGSKRLIPTAYIEGLSLDEQPKPAIKTVMTARLSADRRVVDEATAAMFMQVLQFYLSKPQMLML